MVGDRIVPFPSPTRACIMEWTQSHVNSEHTVQHKAIIAKATTLRGATLRCAIGYIFGDACGTPALTLSIHPPTPF